MTIFQHERRIRFSHECLTSEIWVQLDCSFEGLYFELQQSTRVTRGVASTIAIWSAVKTGHAGMLEVTEMTVCHSLSVPRLPDNHHLMNSSGFEYSASLKHATIATNRIQSFEEIKAIRSNAKPGRTQSASRLHTYIRLPKSFQRKYVPRSHTFCCSLLTQAI